MMANDEDVANWMVEKTCGWAEDTMTAKLLNVLGVSFNYIRLHSILYVYVIYSHWLKY